MKRYALIDANRRALGIGLTVDGALDEAMRAGKQGGVTVIRITEESFLRWLQDRDAVMVTHRGAGAGVARVFKAYRLPILVMGGVLVLGVGMFFLEKRTSKAKAKEARSGPLTWEQVLEHPEWPKLSVQEQLQARAEWVDKYLVPELRKAGVTESDIEAFRIEENQSWDNGVGTARSFGSSIFLGFLKPVAAAVRGVNAEAGEKMEAAIDNTFRLKTFSEPTDFLGDLIGKIGAPILAVWWVVLLRYPVSRPAFDSLIPALKESDAAGWKRVTAGSSPTWIAGRRLTAEEVTALNFEEYAALSSAGRIKTVIQTARIFTLALFLGPEYKFAVTLWRFFWSASIPAVVACLATGHPLWAGFFAVSVLFLPGGIKSTQVDGIVKKAQIDPVFFDLLKSKGCIEIVAQENLAFCSPESQGAPFPSPWWAGA